MPIRINFNQTNVYKQTLDVMCDISSWGRNELGNALNLKIESVMHFNKFATEEEAVQFIYDNDKNMSEGLQRLNPRETIQLV